MADEDEVMSPAQAALERAEARIAELEARVRAAEDTAARINAARDVEREAAREFTAADLPLDTAHPGRGTAAPVASPSLARRMAIIACAKESTRSASQAVTLLLAASILIRDEFNVDATLASAMCEAIVRRVVLKVVRDEEQKPS